MKFKNKNVIKIGVIGIAGRMGRTIAKLAIYDSEVSLYGGIEHIKHKYLGNDIGELLGENALNIYVTHESKRFFNDLDVVIEFGLEKATRKFVKEASKRNIPFVSGSTGLSKDTLNLFKKYSKKIPIFWSPNMSIGANILKQAANNITHKVSKDFDIDITDIHHKQKRDTPSGTALSIKESIERVLKNRKIKKKIKVSAIRAGDSTGEHSIIFSGNSEKIIIKHVSTSRDIFANGAIETAKWITKQKKGLYNMKDFLTSKS